MVMLVGLPLPASAVDPLTDRCVAIMCRGDYNLVDSNYPACAASIYHDINFTKPWRSTSDLMLSLVFAWSPFLGDNRRFFRERILFCKPAMDAAFAAVQIGF